MTPKQVALVQDSFAKVAPTSEAAAEPELYVKPDDRWEVNDVRHHHVERSERLKQTLHGFLEATRRPGPFAPPLLPDLELEAATEESPTTTESAERSLPS